MYRTYSFSSLKLVSKMAEAIPLTPLSDHDNEEETSNQPASKPSNKRSKK